MPPNLPALGRVRSSAAVNAEIRALALAAWGRPFTDEERVEYQALVVEWAAAERLTGDVVEAA
ncbi:hypothetical protein SGFS_065990 [Streptomyces graminofaciens]|uniref:Uncharacterized protein n=1 Tax=Streptomyces graminofaciens TaxID=68212 RepID=A0ABM7FE16_9ACTN|nr:hypothetical protein [Streptomyces graminofaciens]BBC35305.1 hypothetical protein SGFS_065990 [Streptomyces graminofaciens]